MKLSDLIKEIGDENIKVEYVHERLTNISINKKGVSKITLLTNNLTPNEVMDNYQNTMGFMIWFPTEKYQEACNKLT